MKPLMCLTDVQGNKIYINAESVVMIRGPVGLGGKGMVATSVGSHSVRETVEEIFKIYHRTIASPGAVGGGGAGGSWEAEKLP